MPRALTEQEKCRLCRRLLEKGMEYILLYGIKKVSVDDITKAAGMAKGSFYHHFESKEKFLYELILLIRKHVFSHAEKTACGGDDLKENVRAFLTNLFHMREMVFFLKNCSDINELFNSIAEDKESQIDTDMFEKLLALAGIDTKKIKPGVAHNYMHTLFMIMECDLMAEEDLPQTFDLIMDSFISYIFSAEASGKGA